MKNVLIFPFGSENALEIFRSLEGSTHFNLIGAGSVEDHGRFVFKKYISDLPYLSDQSFEAEFLAILKKFKVDIVIPALDDMIVKLAEMRPLLEEISVLPLIPENSVATITRSKKQTYQHLEGAIPLPQVFSFKNDNLTFPLFVKPDRGQGSQGAKIINSKEDLEKYRGQEENFILTEYLPGKEYTVDCFTNKDGHLLLSQARERKRIKAGISVRTEFFEHPEIKNFASQINAKLNLRGAWFFQIKESRQEGFKLMEVAPRIAGSSCILRGLGINLVQLTLFDRLGKDVEIFQNPGNIILERALTCKYDLRYHFDHIYIDYDDTVIFNEKVNLQAVKLLYACKNLDIKVSLITRHRGDLQKSLAKNGLTHLFHEVIHLTQSEEKKSDYLGDKNAIFIDDSFVERKDVFLKKNIPVYGIDMIEAITDYIINFNVKN